MSMSRRSNRAKPKTETPAEPPDQAAVERAIAEALERLRPPAPPARAPSARNGPETARPTRKAAVPAP